MATVETVYTFQNHICSRALLSSAVTGGARCIGWPAVSDPEAASGSIESGLRLLAGGLGSLLKVPRGPE